MQLSKFLSPLLALSAAVWAQSQHPILHPQTTISQPLIGFGTWGLLTSPENITAAVSIAIQVGYRQIDCAAIYRNEKAVGKGIAEGLAKANLSRSDIWVTSKLWNTNHGNYETVEKALNQTLSDLGLDYLDLYLIHWPVGYTPDNSRFDHVETWKSMIELPTSKTRNVGISNFSPKQLRDLIRETGVKPFAHQMELHPYLQQTAWVTTHEALGISVTAYSPLANSNPTYKGRASSSLLSFFNKSPPPLLKNEVLNRIGEKSGCTAAQVALQWGIGRGTSVIPKSEHENHIRENFESSKCELSYLDLGEIKAEGVKHLKRFSNPSKSWGVKLYEGLDDA